MSKQQVTREFATFGDLRLELPCSREDMADFGGRINAEIKNEKRHWLWWLRKGNVNE